jgi:hypothetical protein
MLLDASESASDEHPDEPGASVNLKSVRRLARGKTNFGPVAQRLEQGTHNLQITLNCG